MKIPLLRKKYKARNLVETWKIYQKCEIENNHFEMDDPVTEKVEESSQSAYLSNFPNFFGQFSQIEFKNS